MCAIDDAEYNDVHRITHVRARKTHVCEECSRSIAPGEVHQRLDALHDGRWTLARTCAHCEAAGAFLDLLCGGYLVGGLDEELGDHWQEYGTLSLGRILVARARRWQGVTPEQVRAWANESVDRIKRAVAA